MATNDPHKDINLYSMLGLCWMASSWEWDSIVSSSITGLQIKSVFIHLRQLSDVSTKTTKSESWSK